MANINIKNGRLEVENGADQLVSDSFTVTVPLNNRETHGWGNGFLARPHACMYVGPNGDEVPGHKAEVRVSIHRNGSVIDSAERTVCAPVEGTGQPDPRETFTFSLSDPGAYDVRATVDPLGPDGTPESGSPSDTVTRTIRVETTGNAPPADDGGNEGGGPFDGDGSGNPFGGGSNPVGSILPNGDVVAALIALALIAWLASSASDVTEAVA